MQEKKEINWSSVLLYSLLVIVLTLWVGAVWLSLLNMTSP